MIAPLPPSFSAATRTRHEIQSHDRNQTAASDRMRERIDAFSSRRPRSIEISGEPSAMLLFFAPRLGVKCGSIGLAAAKATIEATLVSWQSSSPNQFSVLRNEFPGRKRDRRKPSAVAGQREPRSRTRGEASRDIGERVAEGVSALRARGNGALGPSSPVIARPAASRAACGSRFIAAALANKVEILKVSL